MASSGWVLVDDADPRIQYSPGWQPFVNGSELDGTKHGAAAAGLTASFSFTGTQVAVVGSLGSVDVHGIPTTLYALDGVEAGFYTAPVIPPGLFELNVTFFSSKSLAPGEHTLVVTNVNGTSPNVFWLDYIEYIPSAASTTTAPSSTSQSPSSQSLTTSSTSTASAASNQPGPSGTAPQSPITTTGTAAPTITQTSPSNSNASTVSSTSHNHVGAIAGGIVGGVVALVLAIALLLRVVHLQRHRRRLAQTREGASSTFADPPSAGVTAIIRPFGSWRSPDTIDPPASPPVPSQKQMMPHMASVSTSTPTLSATLPSPPPPPPTISATALPTHTRPRGLPPTTGAAADSVPTERSIRSSDPPSTPSSSSGPAGGQAGTREEASAAAADGRPQVMHWQSVDSGLRLQLAAGEGEAVVLPPPYTRE